MKEIINEIKKMEKILKQDLKMLKGSLYKTKQKCNYKNVKSYDKYLFTYFKNGKHFSKYIKQFDYEKVNKHWKNYLKYYNEKKKLRKLIDKYFKKLTKYENKNLIDIKNIIK